jgi:processing peptidase subunit beta
VAPGRNDPDFFAMNYFKRLIGEYRVDKHTGTHLNTPKLQYNSFHTDLGNYADIIMHKPFYFAYSDTALFGNFFFGNEVWNRQMLLLGQNKMSEYAAYVTIQ